MTMNSCPMYSQIDRHFAGTITPDAERTMREHMPTCDVCRDRYRRHLLAARLDPKALPAWERIARGLGQHTRFGGRTVRLGVMTAVAAAAAVGLFRVHAGPGDTFSSRGHSVSPTFASRVFVYDVPHGSPPRAAHEILRSGDELAFAYENGAAKRRLAIFGVDEHGHVYWFHPGWTREADDPVAIPIETGAGRHELPEAVLQRFDGERLEIRSVFLDDPISVRQIEGLLSSHPHGPLPLTGAIETSLTFSVLP